jgi:formylglycine-generating enzyme required for sulfatase activity
MPCPPRWWDDELTHLFMPVCWDRGVRLPRYRGATRPRPVPGQVTKPDVHTEQLLSLLGTAIRVEPALLRAVRYILPVQADVGSEAMAWNHPQVHATPLALYYDRAAIAHYHAAFAAQPAALRQRVAQLLLAHHAHLSSAIGHEEALLLAETVPVATAEQAQEFLARLAQTLWQHPGADAAPVQDWARRLGRRQWTHAVLWQHNEPLQVAWAMTHRAALRAGTHLALPHGFDLARVSWVLTSDSHPRSYVLRQRGHLLYIEAAEQASEAEPEVMGSPLALLRAAAPYVQVTTAPAASAESTTYALGQGMPLAPDSTLYLRTDTQELIIDSMARPAWAESIGRDAQGLFVTWAWGQRRAYWVPPGRYPVVNSSGTPLGHVEIAAGYWEDAEEALALLHDGFRPPSWAMAYGVDDYGLYADWSVQGVVQRMRWIRPGEFQMGSPADEPERYDAETQHAVLLTRGFWLAATACTQALWQAVMRSNLSRFKGAERPVQQVGWQDVQGFLERLNALVSGGAFRLPTEAEWEYACRAGTTTPFWFGKQITPEQANYDGNYPYNNGPQAQYRQETVPVQALPCNGWGLYQMHGNVWEWCQDRYDNYATATAATPAVDPSGPAAGEFRVLRGGSWFYYGRYVRSASRLAGRPGSRDDNIGFRLARGQGVKQVGPEARVESREQGRPQVRSAGEEARRARRRTRRRRRKSS